MAKVNKRDYGFSIEIGGDIFEVEFEPHFGRRHKISRWECKHQLKGVPFATWQAGEVTYSIWKDKNGEYWYGDDWYSDSTAVVYPAYLIPF